MRGSREDANGIEWELGYDPFSRLSRRPLLVRTLLVAQLCVSPARHIRFLPSYPFAAAIDQASRRAGGPSDPTLTFDQGRPTQCRAGEEELQRGAEVAAASFTLGAWA